MLFLEGFSLPLRGARQARGRSLKREISLLSRVVQLHHRTRVPPPYHSNLDRAAHIFLRRSAEFPEPADEFPDARRSIENLMLHYCSAQCQQDFRHECLRSALPTCRQVVIQRQDVLVDPRNLEKPVELAVALHRKTTWHTHAQRSLALTAINNELAPLG